MFLRISHDRFLTLSTTASPARSNPYFSKHFTAGSLSWRTWRCSQSYSGLLARAVRASKSSIRVPVPQRRYRWSTAITPMQRKYFLQSCAPRCGVASSSNEVNPTMLARGHSATTLMHSFGQRMLAAYVWGSSGKTPLTSRSAGSLVRQSRVAYDDFDWYGDHFLQFRSQR
jgi:hypothetical protein